MPTNRSRFSAEGLRIDPATVVDAVAAAIREQVKRVLGRRGVVLGLSGGVDSTVVAALAVRALGAGRVLGLLMPEADSSEDSLDLGRAVSRQLGIASLVEDVTPILEAAGCYRRRDEAVRRVIPEFGPGYRCKIVLPSLLSEETGAYRLFSVVVRAPDGTERQTRLTPEAYRGVVAATSFKQRTRKMLEYYHADRLHYAVAGTPNRLEYDQGFFVKGGDGTADLKPIAHLYKTQVYELGRHLGVPAEILDRPPTTDTYPLAQSQEEFYFSLSYARMDLCLLGKNRDVPPAEVALAAGLSEEQVRRVYRDIESKRRATRYQHARPLLVEPVVEIAEG